MTYFLTMTFQSSFQPPLSPISFTYSHPSTTSPFVHPSSLLSLTAGDFTVAMKASEGRTTTWEKNRQEPKRHRLSILQCAECAIHKPFTSWCSSTKNSTSQWFSNILFSRDTSHMDRSAESLVVHKSCERLRSQARSPFTQCKGLTQPARTVHPGKHHSFAFVHGKG